MKFYWQLTQSELASALNQENSPGWCLQLSGLMFRFIQHYQLVPDKVTWIEFCKLNFETLIKKREPSKLGCQTTLADEGNRLSKISGTNCYFQPIQAFVEDKFDKFSYIDCILIHLKVPNSFLFVSFEFNNRSPELPIVGGGHCISIWNHRNKIMLYDPNIGIADLYREDKKEFKHNLHNFFTLHSEDYMNQLITSHQVHHFLNDTNVNKQKHNKWVIRDKNLHLYLGYQSLSFELNVPLIFNLSTSYANLNNRNIMPGAYECKLPDPSKFKLNEISALATLQPNLDGLYNMLKKSGMWN